MNLYLRALGFSDMDSKLERKFIKSAVKQCIDEGFVLKNELFKRGVIIVQVSKSTGIYVFGRYEGKKFIYEYHFPFVVGNSISDNDELVIERHLDKESYAVICDELKAGVTLIFYLQNVMDYLDYVSSLEGMTAGEFNPDRRTAASKNSIRNKPVSLTALSIGGMILLPVKKSDKKSEQRKEAEYRRKELIAAAKNGDKDAMESLTLEDIDLYNQISVRAMYQDVFTIVDTTFMPCGVECDQYSVIGEILDLEQEENIYTGENIYLMTLNCNDMIFTMAINEKDLLGEPEVGRRFKGQVWLQGNVKFKN